MALDFHFLDETSADPNVTVVHSADGKENWPETIPDSLASLREQNNRVRVFVSPDQAYVQRFRLPLAVLPHLHSAVALQLPKLLPLEARELLTDFEVSAKDPTQNVASIDLAALKKDGRQSGSRTLRLLGPACCRHPLGPTFGAYSSLSVCSR